MTEVKHGGYRANAGRKAVSAELKEEREAKFAAEVAREFVFPALCQAFKADPGRWKSNYLSVSLSKLDIKRAYGQEGLAIWMRYFKQEKVGGRDKQGNGYKTRWTLHLGSYDIAKLLVESLGHTLKELPDPGFPPAHMVKRLAALDAKADAREVRKLKEAAGAFA